jgi:hypothetical protein
LHHNGYLCIWLTQPTNPSTLTFKFTTWGTSDYITSITNVAKPTTNVTLDVSVSVGTIWTSLNLTNPVTGTGTTNYIPKWTGTTTQSNSLIYDDGTNIGIGTASPANKLHVLGDVTIGTGSANDSVRNIRSGGCSVIEARDANHRIIIRGTQDTSGTVTGNSNNMDFYEYGNFNFYTDVNTAGSARTHTLTMTGGNVGIGTALPAEKLHISDLTDFIVNVDDTVTRIGTQSNYDLAFVTNRSTATDSTRFVIKAANAGEALRIDANNNVGIGLTNPTEKLDVSGNANISGHLSAATKSFLIDHPTKEGKKLQYGSLESPYHGVRLTGRSMVVRGKCVVELPEYIKNLVHDDETVNVQITNYKHAKTLYVDSIDIPNNRFTIKNDNWFAGKLEFFWTFTATRKDVPDLIVEK